MASASMKMDVKLDDRPVRDAVRRLAAFGSGPLDAASNAIGGAMVSSTVRRFGAQRDPMGNPWKPSKRALKEHGLTLVEHGHLRGGIAYNLLPGKGLEWGSALAYAAVHQEGATFTRAARKQTIYRKLGRDGAAGARFVKKGKSNFAQDVSVAAHSITIPARPYLGIDADDEREIEDTYARALVRAALGEGGAL